LDTVVVNAILFFATGFVLGGVTGAFLVIKSRPHKETTLLSTAVNSSPPQTGQGSVSQPQQL
jgi:hypothetical protein